MRLRCGAPSPLSSMPLSPGSSGRIPQRRIFRFFPLWLDSDRVAWGPHAKPGHFHVRPTQRQPSAVENALQTRPEVVFLVPETCKGQDMPGNEWDWALGVWRILLPQPSCAPNFTPLSTGHTDPATAQQPGDCRTNPPRACRNRSGKATTSGYEVPMAAGALSGWHARSGARGLAAASPTHGHMTGVYRQRRAEAPHHPEATHTTSTDRVGRVRRRLGTSGRLRTRSAARHRTADLGPVGRVAACGFSGHARRDGRPGLVDTPRSDLANDHAQRTDSSTDSDTTPHPAAGTDTGNPPKDNLLHGRAQHNATARAQPLHRPSSFRTTHSAHPLSAVPVDAAQPAHQPPAAAATSLIAACAIARIFYGSWGPGPVLVL